MIVLAIDGPSGSGKSSISKKLAKKMNFLHLDTGAMYRALTFYYLENSIDINNEEEIKKYLNKIEIDFKIENNEVKIYLNNKDVSKEIRTSKVTNSVSLISSYASVRDYLIPVQRSFAKKHNLVVDGRDIASKIFPNADLKIFLDASVEERAKRRYIQKHGESIDKELFEKTVEEIKIRDEKDSSRKESPTKIADAAIVLDSSKMTEDEVFETIYKMIKEIGA